MDKALEFKIRHKVFLKVDQNDLVTDRKWARFEIDLELV